MNDRAQESPIRGWMLRRARVGASLARVARLIVLTAIGHEEFFYCSVPRRQLEPT
jgi:hypothetical protein